MKALLKQLLPPVSYATDASRLDAELEAEAHQLTLTRQSAERVSGAVTPFFAQALLPDWERVLGITPNAKHNYQQRLEMVLLKLAETGGLSVPYFTSLASRLGYHITIEEPLPFRTGVNRAGERLMHPDSLWVWVVNIHGNRVQNYRFRAGNSLTGERLSAFADTVIESIFDDLKPAHTYCYFTYQE
ncbi:putative phage tail protein [Xenorhabdus sp. SGI240]|uniref:YmfQ family protein n=1 Tax=Xenorhabdus sp. SGI240 TaxID=3158262 RepID=UPI0032B73758